MPFWNLDLGVLLEFCGIFSTSLEELPLNIPVTKLNLKRKKSIDLFVFLLQEIIALSSTLNWSVLIDRRRLL